MSATSIWSEYPPYEYGGYSDQMEVADTVIDYEGKHDVVDISSIIALVITGNKTAKLVKSKSCVFCGLTIDWQIEFHETANVDFVNRYPGVHNDFYLGELQTWRVSSKTYSLLSENRPALCPRCSARRMEFSSAILSYDAAEKARVLAKIGELTGGFSFRLERKNKQVYRYLLESASFQDFMVYFIEKKLSEKDPPIVVHNLDDNSGDNTGSFMISYKAELLDDIDKHAIKFISEKVDRMACLTKK